MLMFVNAHHRSTHILHHHKIVNLNPDDIVTMVSADVFPHGVGHHIGLQVHDPAGHVADDRERHYLRLNHTHFTKYVRLKQGT